MPIDAQQRPNVIPWPPVLLVLLAIAAVGANWILSAPPPAPELAAALRIAGVTLCATGISLDLWAILTMYQHRTNILPHRAADRLVTSGPFGFSRNPIYLGNTTLLAGIGFILANPMFLIAAALNVLLVGKLAIAREEAHLARCFGSEWQNYAARVPRWIGPVRRS
jgi:protein-S-isoprenylcysteine O-methyltransferase Ste14